MSLMTIRNLGLTYGARDVFGGLSIDLPDDAKVGLVGPNGIGKTSLLRILSGVSAPSTGGVHVRDGTRIGYLRQEAVDSFVGHDHSVYDEMLTVFAPLHAIADRLRALEARMAAGEATPDLLAEYGAAQESFERGGGYDYDVRIKRVLDGLGFGPEQWKTPVDHLSGGQMTRALLARLLLEEPTLLILDEPTNHLDVEAIEWLETTLRAWNGTLLIASHDRYFLDKVVDRIWEMSPTHIESFRGNYSAYVHQRHERWDFNQQRIETEIARLQREMELVRRYIAWRKFDEAKGKLKRLSRDLVAIEKFGILGALEQTGVDAVHMMSVEEAHERIKGLKPPAKPPVLRMHLKTTHRSGSIVMRTRKLQIGYGSKALFTTDDVLLERLERVALIGPNGTGKSTFLRTVLGQLPPVAGEIVLGAGLKIGYFAQAHDMLSPDNSVFDELLTHRNMPPVEARNYLAQYLFRGDDVWKPVGALSGGERARLALAILALDGVNLLLLDEPTNHLDIPAQEVLQELLDRFDGTLLMVSHDRYLIDALATQIWSLQEGRLRVFKGSYQEFVEESGHEEAAVKEREAAERESRAVASAPTQNDARAARARAKMLADLEEQIAAAEAALAAHSQRLQELGEAGDVAGVQRLAESYAQTNERLEQLMAEWASLAEEAEG